MSNEKRDRGKSYAEKEREDRNQRRQGTRVGASIFISIPVEF